MNIQEMKEKAELFANDVQVQVMSLTEDLSTLPEFLKKNIEAAPANIEKAKVEIEQAVSKLKDGTFFDEDVKKDLHKVMSNVEVTLHQLLDSAKDLIQKAK